VVKRRPAPVGGGGNFVVLYTALSVILLSFFVLMNSIAKPDADRRARAMGSLGAAFSLFHDGTRTPNDDAAEPEAVDLGGGDTGDLADLTARFSRRIAALAGGDGVEVQRGHDDVRITLSGTLLFEPGKAELHDATGDLLARVAAAAEAFPGTIRIEGHTAATEGDTATAGWLLSGKRAVAVMRYLHESAGIAESHLAAAGFGPYRPVGDNDTVVGQGENRRVEIVFVGASRWTEEGAHGQG